MSVCTNCGGGNPSWREVATGAHRCLRCLLDNGKGKAHVLIPGPGDLAEIDTDGDEEPTLPDDQGEDDEPQTAAEEQEESDRAILDEIEQAGAGYDPFFAWDEIALSLSITGDEAESLACALEAGREQARKLMAVIRRLSKLSRQAPEIRLGPMEWGLLVIDETAVERASA
jgi:hypothetical protein